MTAAAALDHDVPGLVGFGVGGSEQGFPRSMFTDQFDRARAAGLHSVPHAGRDHRAGDRSGTRWQTCSAERIEHGIAAVHDQRLLAHLAEHDIALDVCPTSNVALRVVPDLDEHPIRELVAAGVTVTINTDDPPMFSTDLNAEYAIAARLLDLDEQRRGRPGPNRRSRLLRGRGAQDGLTAEIDAYAAAADPPAPLGPRAATCDRGRRYVGAGTKRALDLAQST